VGVGLIMFTLVATISHRPQPEMMGPYFLQTTVQLAGGANAVNTILVDYRGFDTMGEITVLVISLLGALGLFMRWKEGES
jgi:multisubunit Na+/H+ antiporter MnhB subunit